MYADHQQHEQNCSLIFESNAERDKPGKRRSAGALYSKN